MAELILESDSDTHALEDEDIPAQSGSDTVDSTDTNLKQSVVNTNCPTVPVVHTFTGHGGLQQNEAPHIIKDSSPLGVFMFFFEIVQLLVEETNRYHLYLDTLDKAWSLLPDMTVQEM
jgi:hypothetical protein